jgi:hypothetical protein
MLWLTVVQTGTPRQAETNIEAKNLTAVEDAASAPACRNVSQRAACAPGPPTAKPRGTHSTSPGWT